MKLLTQLTLLASNDFNSVGTLLADFLNSWWGPLLTVIGATGGILGAVFGLKFWQAYSSGDENKIKNAKHLFIGILIGFAGIFVLAALIPVIVAAFKNWFESQGV